MQQKRGEGETKEKNSIIRYEPAEGAPGRKAANNERRNRADAWCRRTTGGVSQVAECCLLSLTHSAFSRNDCGELPEYSTPCPNIYPVTQREKNTQLKEIRKDQAQIC